MEENWLPVIGYEGSYEVSDHGRVRSVARRICWDNGSGNIMCREFKMIVMRDFLHWKGYREIFLRKPGEKKRKFYVHQLVAIAFIPNPDNHPLVNHRDLDKANNSASNLEWATFAQNTQHYYANREPAPGSDIPF